jgi:transcriptional regulator with XRE-family HTH domain
MPIYAPLEGAKMGRKDLRYKVGKEVRRLRHAYGWTQVMLAKKSGVSVRYIQRIESKNPPDITIDIIVKIARAFGISCSGFLKNATLKR